jgi:hypothetical protein
MNMVRSRCAHCDAVYDRAGWTALPLIETVAPSVVQRYVVNWPLEDAIEVRRCACGLELVRRRSPAA